MAPCVQGDGVDLWCCMATTRCCAGGTPARQGKPDGVAHTEGSRGASGVLRSHFLQLCPKLAGWRTTNDL
jgi:hypothetical protein